MHKVMIVDDYIPILKYLTKLVEWNELGFQVVNTCHSSVNAVDSFTQLRPDVLITDIDMPQLNGLELAERCKVIKPDLRIIFLTCHEEYAYVKDALQLQADDYMIKDELTAQKLEERLGKTRQLLIEAQHLSARKAFEQEVYRNKYVIERSFVQRLLDVNERTEETMDFGRKIGVQWNHPQYILGLACLDQATFKVKYKSEDLSSIEYAFYNVAREVASKFTALMQATITVLALEHKQGPYSLFIMMNFQSDLSASAYEQFQHCLQQVRRSMLDYIQVDVRFTCSRIFKGAEEIRKSFLAIKLHEWDFYYSDQAVEYMDMSKKKRWDEVHIDFLAYTTDEIFKKISKKDFKGVMDVFHQSALQAKEQQISPAQWLSACAHWIRILHTETSMDIQEEYYVHLGKSFRWKETVQLIHDKLIALTNAMLSKHQYKAKDPMLEVIDQYINEHISESISLAAVANHLYLNPSYFSRYFKKISGQSFIDYVHQQKVELAARLLANPYESVESVAIKLGYSDRTYFARVFKKYLHVTPSDYRKS